jgi:hypothetical protein
MNFEDDLRDTLRRQRAPEGFAERVIARAAAPRIHLVPKREPILQRFAAVAAGVALMVLVPAAIEQHQERQAGERAGREVLVALHLTKSKLTRTQSLLREMSEQR